MSTMPNAHRLDAVASHVRSDATRSTRPTFTRLATLAALALIVSAAPAAAQLTPRIVSMSPTKAPTRGVTRITVTGSGFDAGIDVRLASQGLPDILPLSVEVGGTSLIVATFDFTGNAPGHWLLLVTNPGGLPVPGMILALLDAPFPTGMAPATAGDGDVLALTVVGDAFEEGAKIRLQRSGIGAIQGVGAITAAGGGSITATFDLRGAGLGDWDLDVTNANGYRTQLADAFEVVAGPRVQGVAPAHAADAGVVSITLSGSRLETGATVTLRAAGHPDVTATSVTATPDGTSLEAGFDLGGVAPAVYDVVVEHAGMRGVLPGGFEVRGAPFVTGVSPVVGEDGALVDVTFDGSGFLPGATARLGRAGQPDVVATSVSVAPGGEHLTARFDLRERALGDWDATVTNPNGLAWSGPAAFEIRVGPRLASVAPGIGEQGASVPLRVLGSSLTSGASLRLERGPVTVAATSVVVSASGDSIRGTVPLSGVDPGAWDVVVRGADGRAAWAPAGFEVVRLHVASATPERAGNGGSVVVVVSGERFGAGAGAKLMRTGEPDITGTDAGVAADGTLLGVTFDLTGAALGAWDLAVHNVAGSADTLDDALTVEPGPAIAPFGLEQAWNDCGGTPAAGTDLTTTCDPDSVGHLYATFRPPHDYEGFVALDVVIDVIAQGDSVPPFWQFVDGGCHATGLDVHDDPPAGRCDGLATPWGEHGAAGDAYITAYAPGYRDQPNRARLLISVIRASSDPVTLLAGQNYYAFHLDLLSGAAGCAGCDVPVDWHWISATFYSVTNPEPMVVRNPGLRTKTVTVHGGIVGPTVSAVWPERVTAAAGVELEVFGHDFWPGAQVDLTRGPGEKVSGVDSRVAPNGQSLTARFDLTGQPAGMWDLVVTNPDKTAGKLPKGLVIDQVTPTLVLAFSARSVDEGVEVRWTMAKAADWSRVWVERGAGAAGPWTDVRTAASTSGDEGVVVDPEPLAEASRWYRLRGERTGRAPETLGTIVLSGVAVVSSTRLDEVAPNPTAGALRVAFTLDRAQPVRVSIVDVQGREVAVIARGTLAAGVHAALWNGETAQGRARPGLYFVRAELGARLERRRVAIVR